MKTRISRAMAIVAFFILTLTIGLGHAKPAHAATAYVGEGPVPVGCGFNQQCWFELEMSNGCCIQVTVGAYVWQSSLNYYQWYTQSFTAICQSGGICYEDGQTSFPFNSVPETIQVSQLQGAPVTPFGYITQTQCVPMTSYYYAGTNGSSGPSNNSSGGNNGNAGHVHVVPQPPVKGQAPANAPLPPAAPPA